MATSSGDRRISQPRLPQATYTYSDPGQTFAQDSGSWVYKAEWNGTINDKLYVEARYGDFGYYFPLIANSDFDYFWRDTGRTVLEGSHQRWQLDRDRKQTTAAATYFLDTGRGSHTLKFGGELLLEQSWEGYQQQWGGNMDLIYNNNVSNQVVFGPPTASCEVGSLVAHDCLTSRAALDHTGFFLNDTWAAGRMTLNAGVRYDKYRGWLPEQEQLAARVGPVVLQSRTFDEVEFFTWNVFAPRVGMTYDLTGDGRTVLKGNYGLYWHNPGAAVPNTGNPNTAGKSATYSWNDINGDRRWQPGEEGAAPVTATLEGTISVDPDIKAPYTHEASVWLERQLSDSMGARAGFVYKTEDDLIQTYQPGRGPERITRCRSLRRPWPRRPGRHRRRRTIQMLGMPNALGTTFPNNNVVMNIRPLLALQDLRGVDEQALFEQLVCVARRQPYVARRASRPISPRITRTCPASKTERPGSSRPPVRMTRPGAFGFPPCCAISRASTSRARLPSARRRASRRPAGPATVRRHTSSQRMPTAKTTSGCSTFVPKRRYPIVGRLRSRLFLDLFNITNSHASETISRATGLSYLKPSAILAPRVARVGFRILW